MHQLSGLKIGILTFHRCINYGSFWQARSLAEWLQSMGHQVSIIDHQSTAVNIAEWKCAYQPTLPQITETADLPLYRKKVEGFFKCFESLPLSEKFPLREPEKMEDFDIIVVGSDEVWNFFHPWFGGCKLFFGEQLNSSHVVSYAATFGNYPATWGLGDEWIQSLRNFKNISVRDENSFWLIKNGLGLEPEIVLDPTLQFLSVPEGRAHGYLDRKYIAVYGHNFSAEFVERITSWSKLQRLPLISIGYRNDWTDAQWITADPHDFSHFINNAQAVATNFFHGCAFSLRYNKPFVCETSDYRSIKVRGLMSLVGAEDRMLENVSELDSVLLNPPAEDVIRRIETLRETSGAYMRLAISLKQLQVA